MTGGAWDAPAAGERPDEDEAGRSLRWRLTSRLTARSRARRFERFMRVMAPRPTDEVLDVGVNDTAWRSSNFLEARYPWPSRITAIGIEPMPTFQRLFPEVRFLVGDGRALPFEDRAFDIGFSNAVVEHVGSRDDQRRFVAEMLRVSRRVWISTPNAAFPVDPHTVLPLVHWLPRRLRHPILRATGNGYWASEEHLNPLTAQAFRSLFPPQARVVILRQRLLALTTVLIAVATLEPPGPSATGATGRSSSATATSEVTAAPGVDG
jgi:hypothetical protein